MAKKPFAVRIEEEVSKRFRALSTVLVIDSAELLAKMVKAQELELNNHQKTAYEALLKAWETAESKPGE